MQTVLIVDDEEHIRNNLREFLEDENYQVIGVDSYDKAKQVIVTENVNYAIIDLKLDNSSEYGGIEIFKFVKQNELKTHCIILSAYPFEGEVEKQFEDSLKTEANFDKILQEAKDNYISKGGELNYILAVIKKLELLC